MWQRIKLVLPGTWFATDLVLRMTFFGESRGAVKISVHCDPPRILDDRHEIKNKIVAWKTAPRKRSLKMTVS
jgi:hypothetical protein